MGHNLSTSHQVQWLRLEKLPSIYASANLAIRPRTATSTVDLMREFAGAVGVDLEKVHVEPNTKYVEPEEKEKAMIRALMRAARDELMKPQAG